MVEQEIVDLATNAEQALDDRSAEEPEREEQGIFSNPLGGLNRLLSTITDVVDRMLPDVDMPGLSQITDLRDRAVEFVQRLTELLVLVAIKNIVLPLVFLAIALKGTLPVAKWLFRMSETNQQEP